MTNTGLLEMLGGINRPYYGGTCGGLLGGQMAAQQEQMNRLTWNDLGLNSRTRPWEAVRSFYDELRNEIDEWLNPNK